MNLCISCLAMIGYKLLHSSYFTLDITWLSKSYIFSWLNRRLELVIEKDRPELVMNRRLEYALPNKRISPRERALGQKIQFTYC